ncbi:MAG: SpoIID/LytB domain-containing protein [Caldilineaceae bacterium]
MLFFLLIGWAGAKSWAADGAQSIDSHTLEPELIVEQTPQRARLLLANHILLDQPDTILGRPRYNPARTQFAVSITPSGMETAHLAQVIVFDAESGARLATLPGHTPRWDAAQNAFVTQVEPELPSVVAAQRLDQRLAAPYPATIRVAHHPENGCRDVADWQVDVIPFEEYVARAVPAEVPASWEFAALAAQAVAARTYAWAQILASRPDYDVTDWANFQMMCDQRFAATDAAVSATAGHYLSAADDPTRTPIIAMYSAENGHPTLTNPNVGYLQAVPDLFSIGRVRWGHGYGLSQWGAQRRALAGHTYAQILGHYYSSVHLQNGLAPDAATAHLITPTNGALAGDWLAWRALTSYAAAKSAEITIGLQSNLPLTPTLFITQSLRLAGANGAWRLPPALTNGQQITVSLYVNDALQEQRHLTVDRSPPAAPTLSAPALVTGTVLPLSIAGAADDEVALNLGWRWQGEELFHTPNSGAVTNDPAAQNGAVWAARAGVDQPGVWYGPYTPELPAGYRYRALFWLHGPQMSHGAITETQALTPVARLDVADDLGNVVLGLRDVTIADLRAETSFGYAPLAVDFYLFAPPKGLELRTAWLGDVDLMLDRVEIWVLPGDKWRSDGRLDWPIYAMSGARDIQAAAFDDAGNMSASGDVQVEVRDESPPQFGLMPALPQWFNTFPISLTIAVTDSVSGLDFADAHLQIGGLGDASAAMTLPVAFAQPSNPWIEQSVQGALTEIDDGRYSAHFIAADRSDNHGRSSAFDVQIDATAPMITSTITGGITGTSSAPWRLQPVTVTLTAADALSGVAALHFALDQDELIYSGTLRIDTGGRHTLRYWAEDVAGNRSPIEEEQILIDLAPPQIKLAQLGGGPNAVWLRWQTSDDGSGVAQVALEVERDGMWTPHPLAAQEVAERTVIYAVGKGEMLNVRMMAVDAVGRESAWVTLTLTPPEALVYLPLVWR